MENNSQEQLLVRFQSIKEDLERWASWVDDKIKELLVEQIANHSVQIGPKYRLKAKDSFVQKALFTRKDDLPSGDPLVDITDKVATRVVLLKSTDVQIVESLILNWTGWETKCTRSFEEIVKEPDRFEYQSVHIIVKPKDWETKPEQDINCLSCEIQIRTLLQHAYAEVSHDNIYKGPYKQDKQILRNLSKAMALMEATDDYFCNIYTLMTDTTRKYSVYYNELVSLYKEINHSFIPNSATKEIADLTFEMVNNRLDEFSIKNIARYTTRYSEELHQAIDTMQNNFLFQQPIILLLGYWLKYKSDDLSESWLLSDESLRELKFGFGESTEY